MVTLNLTLVIQVVLFLIFLWGTARFILRPILAGIDERENAIEVDHERAAADSTEAEALESQYAQALSAARLRADEAFRHARYETQKAHTDAVVEATEARHSRGGHRARGARRPRRRHSRCGLAGASRAVPAPARRGAEARR